MRTSLLRETGGTHHGGGGGKTSRHVNGHRHISGMHGAFFMLDMQTKPEKRSQFQTRLQTWLLVPSQTWILQKGGVQESREAAELRRAQKER
jgi:hypothetical protein